MVSQHTAGVVYFPVAMLHLITLVANINSSTIISTETERLLRGGGESNQQVELIDSV